MFAYIAVSSEDERTQDLAASLGVDLIHRRKSEHATDDSPDIDWVRSALDISLLQKDAFAILRPTSPFRTADNIRRAWQIFQDQQPCDSLRAVQPVTEHPMKMWRLHRLVDRPEHVDLMEPLLPVVVHLPDGTTQPAHSTPTQGLPPYYVQNAGLEIAWTRVVTETGTISGTRILPFVCPLLDINTEVDWQAAERQMESLTHG